ncbi:MAG TPA: glycosyltransferase [Candidatus Limnocylindria bacterium]
MHDFFVADGGAEQCAVEFARMFPTALMHTTFFDADRFGGRLAPERVRTWPLQHVPRLMPRFRALFPLYAAYFSAITVDADLVVSSSIAFSKAVRTRDDALHVSYVYTPMRYAWDLDTYLAQSSYPAPAKIAARWLRPMMRRWDRWTARRPNRLVAISQTVADRIQRAWGRDVDAVIYPPVQIDEIPLSRRDDGFLLVAARLLAYRRIDIAVQACTALGRELVVVGEGPERRRLEALAGPSVTFLGHIDRPALLDLFARCHAYITPGIEDFGIAPVEAMAAGKPVIAFGSGGVTETVEDGVTGILVHRQEADAFADAIQRIDELGADPSALRGRARRFDASRFRHQWGGFLDGEGVR